MNAFAVNPLVRQAATRSPQTFSFAMPRKMPQLTPQRETGSVQRIPIYLDLNVLSMDNDGNVYGVNGLSTPGDFFVLRPGPAGVTSKTYPRIATGFSDRIVFAAGRIYSESGDVFDVSNPAAPTVAGKLPSWGGVLPLPDTSKVLLLTSGGADGNAPLTMVDSTTFGKAKSVEVKGVTEYWFPDIDVIGKDTIVFLGIDLIDKKAVRLLVARTSLLM